MARRRHRAPNPTAALTVAHRRDTVPLLFTNGTQRRVPPDIAATVVGLDSQGHVVVVAGAGLAALTPCCYAVAVGAPPACASCGSPVAAHLTDRPTLTELTEPAHYSAHADGAPICGYVGPARPRTVDARADVTCPACRMLLA